MIGKYSPTVQNAYSANQNWFKAVDKNGIYDAEGFDSYGYNEKGVDRAGNEEDFYANGDYDPNIADWAAFQTDRYCRIAAHWGWDGKRIAYK